MSDNLIPEAEGNNLATTTTAQQPTLSSPTPPITIHDEPITIQYDSITLPRLTDDPGSWNNASLLSVTQLAPSGVALLLQCASDMRRLVRDFGGDDRLKHKIVGTVFYEASTRTACSFRAAAQRLGGTNIHVDVTASGNSSSAKKGETLEDTIRCLECYTDVTVLRHPVQGSVGRVISTAAQKPVLSAGDGVGEHPTQALLDVYTIYDELNVRTATTNDDTPLQPLTIVLLGDLKHGRTVHSLAKLLAATRGVLWEDRLTLRYCAPAGLDVPDAVHVACAAYDGVQQEFASDLAEATLGAQVLYVTRVQKERFASDEAYQRVKGSYIVNADYMAKIAPPDMIVLHPLPRVDEIATEVDADPRAAYFRQMENGMFVRMALLSLVVLGQR